MATAYVKMKCELCKKMVTQYLTITPGNKPLKFGKRGILTPRPMVVCKVDLKLLQVS